MKFFSWSYCSWAEVGSNKVQILHGCTMNMDVDFWGISTLLEYFFLSLLFSHSFAHIYLYFLLFTFGKLAHYFCVSKQKYIYICLSNLVVVLIILIIIIFIIAVAWGGAISNLLLCNLVWKWNFYFKYLYFEITVQYIFGLQKNKNVENNIGSWYW